MHSPDSTANGFNSDCLDPMPVVLRFYREDSKRRGDVPWPKTDTHLILRRQKKEKIEKSNRSRAFAVKSILRESFFVIYKYVVLAVLNFVEETDSNVFTIRNVRVQTEDVEVL